MHQKFRPVSEKTKKQDMDDYLNGDFTTRQIGKKYKFSHRNLRKWFEKIGKLKEFEDKSRTNMSEHAKKPMPAISKVKIRGLKNIQWRDGIKINAHGGILESIEIKNPDHPGSNKNGYIYEHRLVMEEHIGRRLAKEEIIHHIDMDPSNNDISNLLLIKNSSIHAKLHYLIQLAMVQLMGKEELRKLNEHLLPQAEVFETRRTKRKI